ncbi:MAG: ABC transporter ATP-binding protein [Actinobacteria bacterium]|nr:ABC transporter ATP-binding protein [Actinomycetota bacterium]MBV9254038.1 ABC transporter ATP-binding protein [Actinomycetota bacterium]
MSEPFLAADGVTVRFGGLTAVDSVSVVADRGETVGIIGPNGAGKTTLFGALCGSVPAEGTVRVEGQDAGTWAPHRRARAGLTRTFQQRELFGSLTVRDNLLFATEAAALGQRPMRLARRHAYRQPDKADATIELLGLQGCAGMLAGSLPGGLARLVEIGRALCTDPALVLLDEPSSGLDNDETAQLVDRLRAAAAACGCGLLLVEHDMSVVNALCERLYVLDFGSCIASGPTAEVLASAEVREAYLGDLGAA